MGHFHPLQKLWSYYFNWLWYLVLCFVYCDEHVVFCCQGTAANCIWRTS